MSENPLFSVIIPAYNREKLVGSSLCSVAAQSFTDWECIVVDDGSADGTRVSVRMIAGILKGVAEKEKTKIPDIRLIKQANAGPGAARNRGAAEAKGKYLVFLDSDDLWLPWTLETYWEALEKADWPECLAGRIQDFSEESEVAEIKQMPLQFTNFKDAIEAGAQGKVCPGAGMLAVSAEAFQQVGGFCTDRLNGEDHDLVMKLGACRGFAAIHAPVVIAVRQHGIQETASMTKAVGGMRRLLEQERCGEYPGGGRRASERQNILTAHTRPVCLAALRDSSARGGAWRLYWMTLAWQMKQMRLKFVLGFPVMAFLSYIKGGSHD